MTRTISIQSKIIKHLEENIGENIHNLGLGKYLWFKKSTSVKLHLKLWRSVWRFLKKLEIELPYNPAVPLLGIHTTKSRIEGDTHTPMVIPALFTIARTWKQPRCPPEDEWIRKMWYTHKMDYSVQFSHSDMSNSLLTHEPQHSRPPCPSPTAGVHPKPSPLSR